MRLLLATRNPHKAREIGEMLRGLPIRLTTLEEFPGISEVEEDGATLEENARKKAASPARESGLWALADDTGLEVSALEGAPGVRSARYAGPDCDYAANNKKLLAELRGVPARRRGAVFRCVMALTGPEGRTILEEGRLEGRIVGRPRGKNGFGYDPLFLVLSKGKTLAELSAAAKNELSHRSLALRKIRSHLEGLALESDEAPRVLAPAGGIAGSCPRCGLELEDWHCRRLCRGCGFQMDCTDPF